jgi:hypothetical protein
MPNSGQIVFNPPVLVNLDNHWYGPLPVRRHCKVGLDGESRYVCVLKGPKHEGCEALRINKKDGRAFLNVSYVGPV